VSNGRSLRAAARAADEILAAMADSTSTGKAKPR